MPESRGRKKKPSKSKRRPARPNPPTSGGWPPSARPGGLVLGKYAPGRLKANEEQLGGLLLSGRAAPDLIVELLPAMLWLYHMSGQRANACVDGCMVLHHAYRQLGIRSEPRAVDLIASDSRRDRNIYYGRSDPHWDDRTFYGHCVLWLPGSGRFLDPTVEQYPEVRQYRLGPICGRPLLAQGSAASRRTFAQGVLEPGATVGVQREDLMLAYTVVDNGPGWIIDSDLVQETLPRYHRAGVNLASHALMLLRQPEVLAQIQRAAYPRLHAVLKALGDVEPVIDDAGDYYFDIDGVPARLDELPIPGALVPEQRTPLTPATSGRDAREVRDVMDNVETHVRALVVGEQPAVLFEPEQALMLIPPGGGPATEAQADAIVSAGFTRFTADLDDAPTKLLRWTLTRRQDVIELRDSGGGPWARGFVDFPSGWLDLAETQQEVLVLYGTQLGVRDPGTAAEYTEADRQAELARGRAAGFTAAARLPWRSTPSASVPSQRQEPAKEEPARRGIFNRLVRALRA